MVTFSVALCVLLTSEYFWCNLRGCIDDIFKKNV